VAIVFSSYLHQEPYSLYHPLLISTNTPFLPTNQTTRQYHAPRWVDEEVLLLHIEVLLLHLLMDK
jgi:hypothetical protein